MFGTDAGRGVAADPPVATNNPPAKSAADKAAERAAAKVVNGRVTRADLAAAYLRVEQAYFAHPPQGERNAEVNKIFDQATLAFFTGKNADAVRTLSELALSLQPQPATDLQRGLFSLRVSIEPQVWRAGQVPGATARVQTVYEPQFNQPLDLPLKLRLIGPQSEPVFERAFQVRVGPGLVVDETLPIEIAADRLVAGLYRAELQTDSGPALAVAQVSAVAGGSLAELREAHERRLAAVMPKTPALAAALTSCRARNALLTDQLSHSNSAQFLADLHGLARDVEAEVKLLEQGLDPYSRRAGDYWRVLGEGKGQIPLRVYAPAAVTSETPAPLLIVLHGAGGDENMFLEGYGVGLIKRLADQHGVLIASPTTNKFGGNPENFTRLVAELGANYQIDPARIYVLGHSMGAGATASLARAMPDKIAAACCLAGGGGYQGKNGIPPVLAVVAELDAVIPPAGLISAAEKAQHAGLPVELRRMPGFGHTLVVGSTLPEAVAWLLEHRLSTAGGR
ncbi:MAG: hypothetical protein JNG90_09370 [Planctomycetaceae bacterium]|nr:hypothetical protein [Planctomycetaceae bacterium]